MNNHVEWQIESHGNGQGNYLAGPAVAQPYVVPNYSIGTSFYEQFAFNHGNSRSCEAIMEDTSDFLDITPVIPFPSLDPRHKRNSAKRKKREKLVPIHSLATSTEVLASSYLAEAKLLKAQKPDLPKRPVGRPRLYPKKEPNPLKLLKIEKLAKMTHGEKNSAGSVRMQPREAQSTACVQSSRSAGAGELGSADRLGPNLCAASQVAPDSGPRENETSQA